MNNEPQEEVKLTPKQEKFVDGILEGKTQTDAYLAAYPRAKNWKRETVWERASVLMHNNKVVARLNELGWRDKTEVLITRERMLKRIERVMAKHEEEMERIQNAYAADKQRVMEELSQWMQVMSTPNIDKKVVQEHINELTQKLINMEKIRTLNSTNTAGILKAADRINRMMGFDITKVEISNADNERDEMEKLTADELKALINIANNKEVE